MGGGLSPAHLVLAKTSDVEKDVKKLKPIEKKEIRDSTKVSSVSISAINEALKKVR